MEMILLFIRAGRETDFPAALYRLGDHLSYTGTAGVLVDEYTTRSLRLPHRQSCVWVSLQADEDAIVRQIGTDGFTVVGKSKIRVGNR